MNTTADESAIQAEIDQRISEWPLHYLFEVYGCYLRFRHHGIEREERIIKYHLTHQQACDLAQRLQRRHQERFPNLSCWTRRYYSARRSYLLP